MQDAAAEALKHFVQTYLVASSVGGTGDITSKYLELLSDPNVAIRRGSALALGVLPCELFAHRWKDVLLKLCNSCLIEVQKEFWIFISFLLFCGRISE